MLHALRGGLSVHTVLHSSWRLVNGIVDTT
jgi:hypothetical protein